MNELALLLGDGDDRLRMEDGIVMSVNPLTVKVGASSVAVAAVSLNPVANGAKVVVLTQGANRVVLGSTGVAQGVWLDWDGKARYGGSTTNMTSDGVYQYDGDFINCIIGWTLSGVNTGGDLVIDLPVAPIEPGVGNAHYQIGGGFIVDAGVGRYAFGVFTSDTALEAIGNRYADNGAISSSNPIAINTGDGGAVNLRYRWR